MIHTLLHTLTAATRALRALPTLEQRLRILEHDAANTQARVAEFDGGTAPTRTPTS